MHCKQKQLITLLQDMIFSSDTSVIKTILAAVKEISNFLRHSSVKVLQTQNSFGDTQLHQDVQSDNIVERHLRKNKEVKAFASEQRPQYIQIGEGQGYIVTYDPLDGSSIIESNFAVGSIFSIWATTKNKLIGEKLGRQINAVMAVYGSRTTAMLQDRGKVVEVTLVGEEWVVSRHEIFVKQETNLFAPGNLRVANELETYMQCVKEWIHKGYTLRYSGGLVPDVNQILVKGHGIFVNVGTKLHKCKLRALYQAAAMGFLIQKAGGKSITKGGISLMDYVVQSYDDRISFAVGSSLQINKLSQLFKNQ